MLELYYLYKKYIKNKKIREYYTDEEPEEPEESSKISEKSSKISEKSSKISEKSSGISIGSIIGTMFLFLLSIVCSFISGYISFNCNKSKGKGNIISFLYAFMAWIFWIPYLITWLYLNGYLICIKCFECDVNSEVDM